VDIEEKKERNHAYH